MFRGETFDLERVTTLYWRFDGNSLSFGALTRRRVMSSQRCSTMLYSEHQP